MMITNIEDYFTKGCGLCERFATAHCVTRQWAEGLSALHGFFWGAGFEALTRGRQGSYVIQLIGAKKAETRIARIVRFRDKILAGKGANER